LVKIKQLFLPEIEARVVHPVAQLLYRLSTVYFGQTKIKGRGKDHPRKGHEDPEGE
jgi:hypothetical protein